MKKTVLMGLLLLVSLLGVHRTTAQPASEPRPDTDTEITPSLVHRFNTTGSFDARSMTVCSDKLFVIGNHSIEGESLWVTDGTDVGTQFVVRLNGFRVTPRYGRSHIAFGNRFCFYQQSATKKNKLWISDGTSKGTHVLFETPASERPANIHLAVYGNELYILQANADGIVELWRTDGTKDNLTKVHSFDSRLWRPKLLTATTQNLLLLIDSEKDGCELWSSRGTEKDTKLVRRVMNRRSLGTPTCSALLGHKLIFALWNSDDLVHEVWASDGRSVGTKECFLKRRNSETAGLPRVRLHPLQKLVLVVHSNGSVYSTDGTSRVTKQLGSLEDPIVETHVSSDIRNGRWAYFVTGNNASRDRQLYLTDGVTGMTLLLGREDVWNRSILGCTSDSIYESRSVHDSNSRSNLRHEIVRTDFAGENPKVVATVESGMLRGNCQPVYFQGNLYVSLFDVDTRSSLWRLSGKGHDAKPMLAFNGGGGSELGDLLFHDGKLFLTADDGRAGKELWIVDLESQRARLVRDIWVSRGRSQDSSTMSSNPRHFFVAGGRVCFVADKRSLKDVIWTTDGTESGTVVVDNINQSYPCEFEPLGTVNDRMCFLADDGVHGKELWVTDGTRGGTQMLRDIGPDGGIEAQVLVNHDETLLLRVTFEAGGSRLWITDATRDGTRQITGLGDEVDVPDVRTAFVVGDALCLLTATDSAHQVDMWRVSPKTLKAHLIQTQVEWLRNATYGVCGGPKRAFYRFNSQLWYIGVDTKRKLVADVTPREFLGCIDDEVFFSVEKSDGRWAVWKSDGSADGTRLVKDFGENTLAMRGWEGMTAQTNNGVLLFSVQATDKSWQLWRTDGNGTSTYKLADMDPTTGTGIQGIHGVGDTLALVGQDAQGQRIWITDGTRVGTRAMQRTNQNGDSAPQIWGYAEGKLYFTSVHHRCGRELWAFDVP